MDSKYNFYAEVINGKLTMKEPELFAKFLGMLKGLVLITIRPRKKMRSLSQNNGYWLLLTWFANELGCEPMELHEYLKKRFLSKIHTFENKKTKSTEVIYLSGSTTDLSTKEFGDYMENIYRTAAEFGIDLPDLKKF